MLKLIGKVLKSSVREFKGSDGNVVKCNKVEILDVDGLYSVIRLVTDYDLINQYKAGDNFEGAVDVKPFVTRNGVPGIEYTRFKK